MNFILIGFKSSGKTVLGKSLAKALGLQFVDTDLRLEALHQVLTGKKEDCRAIYQNYGEGHFRKLETTVIAGLLWADDCVVSTGGGVVLQEGNCRLLNKAGLCIFLDAGLDLVKKRLAHVTTPLFQQKTLEETYGERRTKYQELADITFPIAEGKTPDELATELAQVINISRTPNA